MLTQPSKRRAAVMRNLRLRIFNTYNLAIGKMAEIEAINGNYITLVNEYMIINKK